MAFVFEKITKEKRNELGIKEAYVRSMVRDDSENCKLIYLTGAGMENEYYYEFHWNKKFLFLTLSKEEVPRPFIKGIDMKYDVFYDIYSIQTQTPLSSSERSSVKDLLHSAFQKVGNNFRLAPDSTGEVKIEITEDFYVNKNIKSVITNMEV